MKFEQIMFIKWLIVAHRKTVYIGICIKLRNRQ